MTTSNTGTEMADWGWMEATDMESAISKNLLMYRRCSGQESAEEHLPLASDKKGTSLLLPTNPRRSLKRGEH